MEKCYKCSKALNSLTEPGIFIEFTGPHYDLKIKLCEGCFLKIEEFLQIRGYQDENSD